MWDHAIELLPGAPNSLAGQLPPLTIKEKEEIHKFVQEHLAQGMICISKSPYVTWWTIGMLMLTTYSLIHSSPVLYSVCHFGSLLKYLP